jgi:hypothetical protein
LRVALAGRSQDPNPALRSSGFAAITRIGLPLREELVSGDLTIAMFPDQVRAPDLEVFFSVPEAGDQCGSIFAAIINRWTGPIVEPRFDGPLWDCETGLDVALAGEIL